MLPVSRWRWVLPVFWAGGWIGLMLGLITGLTTGLPQSMAADPSSQDVPALSGISWFEDGIWDIAGEAAFETRVFPGSPAFPGQKGNSVSPSLRLEPHIYYEWNAGNDRLTLTPLLRWDHDDTHRSHIDLRQANWLHIGSDWDFVLGIEQVFWGVTESAHLVNIINQIDQVEDIDGEDTFGQPMINLNLERDSGTYSLFILPGFRKRPFPDSTARLRGRQPVEWRDALFENGASEHPVDIAVRWARYWGSWDIGLSHFYGVSREPLIRAVPDSLSPDRFRLRPVYHLINQTGLDLQYTMGSWLWKLEAITRSGHGDRFAAMVGGFEYSLFGLNDTAVDLGLLMEIHLDGRNTNTAPQTVGNHDIFIGTRLAFNDENDTEMIAGTLVDWEYETILVTIEAGRRMGAHYGIEATARLFFNAPDADIISGIAADDFIRLDLIRYF